MKFTEKGSVLIDLQLLAREENGDLIRFKIADTGIGIKPGKQQVIFDPFTQASTNTTRKFGGTGLGLSIVKQLIEMFGSEIHLESKPGKGTTIYFDLFLRRASHVLPAVKDPGESDQVQLSSLRILLAEDNLMNTYLMQQLFQRWNIKADVAENGEQAVQLLIENQYDLILMDVNMPVINGLEATLRIRKLDDSSKSGIHIVALTGEASEEIKAKLKDHG